MTSKPPYPYLILGKRNEAVTTAGGGVAYTHLLLELWSFVPTVIMIAVLLTAAGWSLSTGALAYQAGWLAVTTFVVLAAIPIALNISELSPWLGRKPAPR